MLRTAHNNLQYSIDSFSKRIHLDLERCISFKMFQQDSNLSVLGKAITTCQLQEYLVLSLFSADLSCRRTAARMELVFDKCAANEKRG